MEKYLGLVNLKPGKPVTVGNPIYGYGKLTKISDGYHFISNENILK